VKTIRTVQSCTGTTVACSHKHTHMSSSYNCTRDCWFSLVSGTFWLFLCVFTYIGAVCLFFGFFLCSFVYFLLFVLSLVVSTSASDCLERLVSEMT